MIDLTGGLYEENLPCAALRFSGNPCDIVRVELGDSHGGVLKVRVLLRKDVRFLASVGRQFQVPS
jgi:hypothetical protein